MTTLLMFPLIGSLAAAIGTLLGLRGPVCCAVVSIAAATVWSLT